MSATRTITRPGMRPLPAELIFACPDYSVFLINGQERVLPAIDGKVRGFTVTARESRQQAAQRAHRAEVDQLSATWRAESAER